MIHTCLTLCTLVWRGGHGKILATPSLTGMLAFFFFYPLHFTAIHPSNSKQVASDSPSLLSQAPDAVPDTASDLLLAQMLQLEFDREHDVRVRAEERHLNKRSKGQCTVFEMSRRT